MRDDRALENLGIALCRIAEKYVVLADEVALERTRKQRVKWIDDNLIAPTIRIRRALSPSSERYFSQWPQYEYERRLGDIARWRTESECLLRWALARKTWFKRRCPGAKPRTDRDYALAFDLICIYARHVGNPTGSY
jgi:hypothetical protein